jgi:hypothetical protein
MRMMIKRLLLTSLFLLAMYTAAQPADLVCWKTNFDDTLRAIVETYRAVPVGEWLGPTSYRLTGNGSAKLSYPDLGQVILVMRFQNDGPLEAFRDNPDCMGRKQQRYVKSHSVV